MRVVLIGERGYSASILRHLLRGWNVVGVVTPVSSGRWRPKTVGEIASASGIEVIQTANLDDDDALNQLIELNPDVCVCAGWTRMISQAVLDIPTKSFLGVHASKLPAGRGGAPVNWAMIHGREEVGVSVFEFVDEVDDGDIYAQTAVPIQDRDDIATVYDRVTQSSCDLLDSTLREISDGTADPTPQDRSKATYRPQRMPEDGLMDWTGEASKLVNWVRALTHPYPGAYTFLNGRRLLVWKADEVNERALGDPGEILSKVEGQGLNVATGDGTLRLIRVQFGDTPPMWGDEFAERYGLKPGRKLGLPKDFPEWLYVGIRDGNGGTYFQTNLKPGETGITSAVACSHSSPRALRISAFLDDERIGEFELQVSGWAKQPVQYSPERGTHHLSIRFQDETGEIIGNRNLMIYAY